MGGLGEVFDLPIGFLVYGDRWLLYKDTLKQSIEFNK
jgi:hypothetical protein